MDIGSWYTLTPFLRTLRRGPEADGAAPTPEHAPPANGNDGPPDRAAARTIAEVVDRLARAPVLLAGCDFDGTLAPIVGEPSLASMLPTSHAALTRLAALPHTHAAIISGRGLDDLRSRVRDAPHLHLAGSHGAELDGARPAPLDEAQTVALREVGQRLAMLAAKTPGALTEHKPRGVALHFRWVEESRAAALFEAVGSLTAEYPTLALRLGSMVMEFVADRVTKREALREIRRRVGATGVLFVGDDLTDEHALGDLGPRDAGVKVGPGDTLAPFRLSGVAEVGALLTALADAREAWLRDRDLATVPIQSHAMLSDQRTIALVTPRARVTWMCLPRLDSPAIFSELVGGPRAGFFEIAPAGDDSPGTHEYEPDSLVLRTIWPSCTVTDYLDCADGRAFHRAGRTDLIRVVEGSGTVRIRFAPRLDFGRVGTRLVLREGALELDGAAEPMVLIAPGLDWRISADGPHQTAETEFDLSAGPLVLELRSGSGFTRPHPLPELNRRKETRRFWSAWVQSLRFPSIRPDLVRRSALALRALCHGPTGAIAAAGTTSLPEHLGGVRNWDYRYCWPRDAALACAALWRLGNAGTPMRLLDWILGVVDRAESPDRLRPIYTLTGGDLGSEAEIGDLEGYAESRPVRVGNAAAQQVQLDVFGPIVDLVAMLGEGGAPISPDHWRLTRAMVSAIEARWNEPDHGIWEVRAPKSHHVHSRTMCFHAVDRALVVHEAVLGRPNPAWAELRERIRHDVLAHGYSSSAGAFTSAYGSDALDAAALQVGLTGLVDRGDPRWASTVEAVDHGLRRGAVVDRYRSDDGLPGREGGFHLCTSWLIESLVSLGQLERARELFDAMAALAGPTGLLAEQHEPDYGIALGNFPQAYSHLALINAAVALDRAAPGRGIPPTRQGGPA